MRKTVEILALSSILFVFVCSTVFPNSPFMWLATDSYNFTLLRIILITLIATLLITTSMFDHHLHTMLGIFAFSLIAWVLLSTYDNRLQILDSLSFLAAGVALGIEALEPGLDYVAPEPQTAKQRWADVKHQFAIYTLAVYALTRLWALSHPLRDRPVHHGHHPHAI